MRISDWSSDVCSSDLGTAAVTPKATRRGRRAFSAPTFTGPRSQVRRRPSPAPVRNSKAASTSRSARGDRKSVVKGKSVQVRVDPGGRRIHKKTNQKQHEQHDPIATTQQPFTQT